MINHLFGVPPFMETSISKVTRNSCPSPPRPAQTSPGCVRKVPPTAEVMMVELRQQIQHLSTKKWWNMSMKSAWFNCSFVERGKSNAYRVRWFYNSLTSAKQSSLRYMVTWFRIAILCGGFSRFHLYLARKALAMYCPKLASIPCVDPH